MSIDKFYSTVDKSNFYLGIISQVFRSGSYLQVENLSLLQHRKVYNEQLTPSTINYYVAIDSVQGLFFGEVYQARVQNTNVVREAMKKEKYENVFPELAISVIGVMDNDGEFEQPGFKTVGINDRVYIANNILTDLYMHSLPVHHYFLETETVQERMPQKEISHFARLAKFDDLNLRIQPNLLFDRHLMVVGTTNSGKSTSSLSILDKLIKAEKKVLIIDPTGEYRDAFEDANVKHLKLGEDTSLPVSEVSDQQWEMLFQTNQNTQGAVLAEAIKSLRYMKVHPQSGDVFVKKGKVVQVVQKDLMNLSDQQKDFDLRLLAKQINEESVEVKVLKGEELYVYEQFRANANEWLLKKVKHALEKTTMLDFFDNGSGKTSLLQEVDNFLCDKHNSLYIDASNIGTTDGIGTMIIDLICNYLINKPKDEINPFVLFVDEVHRYTKFIDRDNESLSGLTSIAREGRKKGMFLFLTTQSPSDVPAILLGQVGTLIIHRLTGIDDLAAIRNYLDEDVLKQVRKLNRGEAVLTSINLLQDIYLSFIKSDRIHHNETPVL